MTPFIIAVGNHKGGVGKTSLVLALAESLARHDKKTLVCDLDPQGSASIVLGVDVAEDQLTMYDLLKSNVPGSIGQGVVGTTWHENLDVVPADSSLAIFADERLTAPEHRLKAIMMDSPELDDYDYVLLDMPPSLGRLTLNGLVAADTAVAVTTPEALAVNGVVQFVGTVEDMQRHPMLNPALRFGGIVINLADWRLNEHRFQRGEIEKYWPDAVIAPPIPARAAIKDMASTQQPVTRTGNRGANEVARMIDELSSNLVKGQ